MSQSYTDREALAAHSFSGDGFTCRPARYARGKMVVCISGDGSGWKNRGMWLIEALGGRWTGRDHGYQVSPARADLWRRMLANGFDAHRLLPRDAPVFRRAPSPDMTLAEASSLLARLEGEKRWPKFRADCTKCKKLRICIPLYFTTKATREELARVYVCSDCIPEAMT